MAVRGTSCREGKEASLHAEDSPWPQLNGRRSCGRAAPGRQLPLYEPACVRDAGLALQAAGFARFYPGTTAPRARALSRLMFIFSPPLLLLCDAGQGPKK